MKPGDLLLGIDGVPTSNLTLYEVSERLKGSAGSEVSILNITTCWKLFIILLESLSCMYYSHALAH